MAQNMIYPGGGSVCTWEKGEIHCFGLLVTAHFVLCVFVHVCTIAVLCSFETSIVFSNKYLHFGFPHGSGGKEYTWNMGNPGSISGLGRTPWEENGNLSSILVWEIPWTEEPDGLQSMGLQRTGDNWVSYILILVFVLKLILKIHSEAFDSKNNALPFKWEYKNQLSQFLLPIEEIFIWNKVLDFLWYKGNGKFASEYVLQEHSHAVRKPYGPFSQIII